MRDELDFATRRIQSLDAQMARKLAEMNELTVQLQTSRRHVFDVEMTLAEREEELSVLKGTVLGGMDDVALAVDMGEEDDHSGAEESFNVDDIHSHSSAPAADADVVVFDDGDDSAPEDTPPTPPPPAVHLKDSEDEAGSDSEL